MDECVRTEAIIIDFSKFYDLVSPDRLLMNTPATETHLRVVVLVKEFLLRHSLRFRVDGQLSEEVTINSEVSQGRV